MKKWIAALFLLLVIYMSPVHATSCTTWTQCVPYGQIYCWGTSSNLYTCHSSCAPDGAYAPSADECCYGLKYENGMCISEQKSYSCSHWTECSKYNMRYCWGQQNSYECHNTCAENGFYAPDESECCPGLAWDSQNGLCYSPVFGTSCADEGEPYSDSTPCCAGLSRCEDGKCHEHCKNHNTYCDACATVDCGECSSTPGWWCSCTGYYRPPYYESGYDQCVGSNSGWQSDACKTTCPNGEITSPCKCGNKPYQSGYCCNGIHSDSPCSSSPSCYDSDASEGDIKDQSYTDGYVKINGQLKSWDYCDGDYVYEYYCDGDNRAREHVKCDYGCIVVYNSDIDKNVGRCRTRPNECEKHSNCGSHAYCYRGDCVCENGYENRDGDWSNGCEYSEEGGETCSSSSECEGDEPGNCYVCWNGQCTKSSENQGPGDGCDKDCQCGKPHEHCDESLHRCVCDQGWSDLNGDKSDGCEYEEQPKCTGSVEIYNVDSDISEGDSIQPGARGLSSSCQGKTVHFKLLKINDDQDRYIDCSSDLGGYEGYYTSCKISSMGSCKADKIYPDEGDYKLCAKININDDSDYADSGETASMFVSVSGSGSSNYVTIIVEDYDTGEKINDAVVTAKYSTESWSCETGITGKCNLNIPTSGTYRVIVSKSGYKIYDRDLSLSVGLEKTIRLEPMEENLKDKCEEIGGIYKTWTTKCDKGQVKIAAYSSDSNNIVCCYPSCEKYRDDIIDEKVDPRSDDIYHKNYAIINYGDRKEKKYDECNGDEGVLEVMCSEEDTIAGTTVYKSITYKSLNCPGTCEDGVCKEYKKCEYTCRDYCIEGEGEVNEKCPDDWQVCCAPKCERKSHYAVIAGERKYDECKNDKYLTKYTCASDTEFESETVYCPNGCDSPNGYGECLGKVLVDMTIKVIDKENKNPISGSVVTVKLILDTGKEDIGSCTTKSDGECTIKDLSDRSNYEIIASKTGYITMTKTTMGTEFVTIELPKQQQSDDKIEKCENVGGNIRNKCSVGEVKINAYSSEIFECCIPACVKYKNTALGHERVEPTKIYEYEYNYVYVGSTKKYDECDGEKLKEVVCTKPKTVAGQLIYTDFEYKTISCPEGVCVSSEGMCSKSTEVYVYDVETSDELDGVEVKAYVNGIKIDECTTNSNGICYLTKLAGNFNFKITAHKDGYEDGEKTTTTPGKRVEMGLEKEQAEQEKEESYTIKCVKEEAHYEIQNPRGIYRLRPGGVKIYKVYEDGREEFYKEIEDVCYPPDNSYILEAVCSDNERGYKYVKVPCNQGDSTGFHCSGGACVPNEGITAYKAYVQTVDENDEPIGDVKLDFYYKPPQGSMEYYATRTTLTTNDYGEKGTCWLPLPTYSIFHIYAHKEGYENTEIDASVSGSFLEQKIKMRKLEQSYAQTEESKCNIKLFHVSMDGEAPCRVDPHISLENCEGTWKIYMDGSLLCEGDIGDYGCNKYTDSGIHEFKLIVDGKTKTTTSECKKGQESTGNIDYCEIQTVDKAETNDIIDVLPICKYGDEVVRCPSLTWNLYPNVGRIYKATDVLYKYETPEEQANVVLKASYKDVSCRKLIKIEKKATTQSNDNTCGPRCSFSGADCGAYCSGGHKAPACWGDSEGKYYCWCKCAGVGKYAPGPDECCRGLDYDENTKICGRNAINDCKTCIENGAKFLFFNTPAKWCKQSFDEYWESYENKCVSTVNPFASCNGEWIKDINDCEKREESCKEETSNY